jgi:hypothetical protein
LGRLIRSFSKSSFLIRTAQNEAGNEKIFVLYRNIKIAHCLLGITLMIYFSNKERQAIWKGFGMALSIMVILAITADYFAEK